MKKLFCFLFLFCMVCVHAHTQSFIEAKKSAHSFPLITAGQAVTIVYDKNEDSLVRKSAELLKKDLETLSGKTITVSFSLPSTGTIIIIGNISRSGFLKQLIKEKKLGVSHILNKWEAFQLQVIKKPFTGINHALVIAGSDRRGTAFGVFELSKQLGISPWYWWADVPVKKKNEIFVRNNVILIDSPRVKYRGIFINDEAPALSNWSREKFGGFNHLFYEKVFELMLRLKANYLWPAMWGSAFYDDDSLNRQSAERYGIVIGTSHHEPLMRAHDEWRRYGKGKWNYDSNKLALQKFWKEGLQRATNEKIVTIGMRGDGDEPMTRETATALLERIVNDQRRIIEEVSERPANETPQLWALYKEVQNYYDKGMRVPDDVTLLLCDDNWGNLRKLPAIHEPKRQGGYGIYYHFDYVGGPRNYKWINTNNLARVWEQMHLAWEYKARQIWIVNVGDIKPMELPTSFFLDYAWDPSKWNEVNLRTYYTKWAEQQFGQKYSADIGNLLRMYSFYSSRRKPELLNEKTYNLLEFRKVLREWKEMTKQAGQISNELPVEYKDAFYQLVFHPIEALANLNELYYAVALNRLLVASKNPSANVWADQIKELFQKDSLISVKYHSVANGKWKHMMSQTHIGYTYWQQPPTNIIPDHSYVTSTQEVIEQGFEDSFDRSADHLIPKGLKRTVFSEWNGVVSINAPHWTKAYHSKNINWKVIPDIGKTGSGITTFPVTASRKLDKSSPHVEYEFYSYDSGKAKIQLYFSPTLNFLNLEEGLQYAVSIDDETPQLFSLNEPDSLRIWEGWVANNIIIKTSEHDFNKTGRHLLRYWMISPGVILQKAVIHFGGLKPSYLGPPETKF